MRRCQYRGCRWRAAVLLASAVLCGCGPALRRDPQSTGGALNVDAARLILVTIDNRAQLLRMEAGSTPHGYGGVSPYGIGEQAHTIARALADRYRLRPVREWPIGPLQVDCVIYALAPQTDRGAVLRALSSDGRVRLAQPVQLFDSLAAATTVDAGDPGSAQAESPGRPSYNDPYLALQRGFAEIDAAGAQRWSRGAGVRIAIIDTGADIHHPDLAGRVATSRNFIDDDQASFETDRHGTGVAGIIAAVANNGLGIVGVAPEARLDIYKACEPVHPRGLAGQCNSFTLALALDAALTQRARIVNLSLGGPSDPILGQLVAKGQQLGTIFVAAMPGSGRTDGFPLDIPGVIAVDLPRRSAPDPIPSIPVLHAPGVDVLSLAPGGHYDFATGSSYAAAHVTGAIALLLARNPRLDAADAQRLLSGTSARRDGGELIDVAVALERMRAADRSAAAHRNGSRLLPAAD